MGLKISKNASNCSELDKLKTLYQSDNIHGIYRQKNTGGVSNWVSVFGQNMIHC